MEHMRNCHDNIATRKVIIMFSGDSMSYNDGAKFSTADRDNDGESYRDNCAEGNGRAGWWYGTVYLWLVQSKRCVLPLTQDHRLHWDLVGALAWWALFSESHHDDGTEDLRTANKSHYQRFTAIVNIFHQ